MTTAFTATEQAALDAHEAGRELTGKDAAALARAQKKIAVMDARLAEQQAKNAPVTGTDDADFVNDEEARAEDAMETDGEEYDDPTGGIGADDLSDEPADGADADETPADAVDEVAEDVPAAGITRHGGNVWHYLKADGKGVRAMCGAADAGVMRQSELRGRTPHSVCAKLAVTQQFVRESEIDWANPNRPLIERADAAPAPAPKVEPKVVTPPAAKKAAPKVATPKSTKKAVPAKAAKKTAPAAKTAVSDRFRPAAVTGWETFLPAARGGAEIAFKVGDHKVMALVCVTHLTVKPVKSMGEARSDRRNGKYCDHADHKNGK